MARQGRKTTGYLYEKNGVWWVQWSAFGKRNRRSTGILVGKGAEAKKNLAAAKQVRDELVAPYKAGAEADLRAALVERQKTADEKAQERMAVVVAEEARIPLSDAWNRFPYNVSQPGWGRTAGLPLSPRNIHENELAWWQFVDWVRDVHGAGHTMQDVTEDWAVAYAKHLQSKGLSPQRQRVLLLVCNVMFRLAGLPSPFPAKPATGKAKVEGREVFTKDQVRTMLDAASGEWKGFLAVLYYTGLRAGDGVLLTHGNRRGGRIYVTTAKTDTDLVLDEAGELTRILDEVVDHRPLSRSTPLFPTLAAEYREKGSAALSRRFVKFMCEKLGEYQQGEDGEVVFKPFVGTEQRKRGVRSVSRYGLHSFRHALAHESCRAGVPIATVQRWLGHTSPAITAIYANHADEEERKKLVAATALYDAVEVAPALPALPASGNAPAGEVEALRKVLGEVAVGLVGMTEMSWREERARLVALVSAASVETGAHVLPPAEG
jgi:integrase